MSTLTANDTVNEMPYGYRWATADEVENWSYAQTDRERERIDSNMVQVRVGGTDDEPWTDLAVKWDCMIEFGMDHDHDPEECERIIADMNSNSYDPMDDIPWGTPDSWIPDNPNEDGFRQSDFI